MQASLPAVPVGQTAVVSMSDLQRIRNQLTNAEATLRSGMSVRSQGSPDDLQLDREERRQKSQDRVKNWGNTLEALRVRKDRRRQEKMEAEEARRKIQDKEEAEFQAQQRRAAIERAQKLLFEDTDRVKMFNSKLSLCDAMKEREFQEQIAKEKREREKQDEEYWHRKTMAQVAEQEAEAERKQEEAMQRAITAKKIQTQQLDEMKERIIQQRLDDQFEGELIRARAVANAEEEERQKLDARLKARQKAMTALAETRRHAADKAVMEREQAEKEDATIRKFADQKEVKQKQREARIALIAQNKHDMRQRMIDRQFDYLMSLRTDEERRLSDQIMKAEEARAAAEAAKEARRAQAMAEGRQFNQAQLDLKRRQLLASKQEGKVEAENLRAMFEDMKRKDADEEEARRQKNATLKRHNAEQIAEKNRRRQQAEETRQEESALMQQQLQMDQDEFMNYAHTTIERVKGEGKNIKPLTLQLARALKPQMTSS